jgi:hypothetical protein
MARTSSKIKKRSEFALLEDFLMIAIGIVIAIALSRIGFIDSVINLTREYYQIPSFIAGIFFTSAFTIAPSSVTLVNISQTAPMSGVVVWGGIGAMFGDLVLFLFIRDRFADDIKQAFRPKHFRMLMKSLHFGFMKWLAPIIGALIIASPLPDEFGITLLGLSRLKIAVLLPVALVMNMLGIYLLITFSHFL